MSGPPAGVECRSEFWRSTSLTCPSTSHPGGAREPTRRRSHPRDERPCGREGRGQVSLTQVLAAGESARGQRHRPLGTDQQGAAAPQHMCCTVAASVTPCGEGYRCTRRLRCPRRKPHVRRGSLQRTARATIRVTFSLPKPSSLAGTGDPSAFEYEGTARVVRGRRGSTGRRCPGRLRWTPAMCAPFASPALTSSVSRPARGTEAFTFGARVEAAAGGRRPAPDAPLGRQDDGGRASLIGRLEGSSGAHSCTCCNQP
ncbi:hypothetical protein SALBM135S_01596 [Streptomyces alboniger]